MVIPASIELRDLLVSLDGKGYRGYKALGSRYRFTDFVLLVDHVQGDPFADPTRVRSLVPARVAAIPPDLLATEARRTAAADFLNRRLADSLRAKSRTRGSGRSGELSILTPGQEVLRRTSFLVHPDGSLEARLRAGLPANGRTILGHEAAELFCEALPAALYDALLPGSRPDDSLRRHVEVVEDAQALRRQLLDSGLVAFIGDGARLPRRSGVDDSPLDPAEVVPFESPVSLRVRLRAPHAGEVTGMGIPAGVTLFVGGGFHGKSTLLRAIERGVYDHVPGDGRERVVTIGDAVKVRAEDGRRVAGVDISNFIGRLPNGSDSTHFHTENASGSTSQAAAIVEALEVGATCLLLDEDTSATNFLIRDARVQQLVASDDEPITPLIDRVRELSTGSGISLVMVVGGSGDYFDVADTVIAMRGYLPEDVTARAKEIARQLPSSRRTEGREWARVERRIPRPASIDPSRGRRDVEVKGSVAERVRFGSEEIELAAVEQLVEAAQTRAIARALAWGRERCIDGRSDTTTALHCIMELLEKEGLDVLDDRIVGDYAEFRIFELAAALGRLRSLEVTRR
jgi:predicted ABC-class ATPase